jgi:serine O-acetyltransferase
MSLDPASLAGYLKRQLDNNFPDGIGGDIPAVTNRALERLEHCFKPVRLRMYRRDGAPYFDHLHSDQYATFLYLAANTAFQMGDLRLAAKLYCLNKALNGFMCTYDTVLPEHFLIVHTAGMLLGKAAYSDYFVAIHNAATGTDRGKTPRIGKAVVIYGGAAIIGDCDIGANVSVAAGALVRNQAVPAGHVVAGVTPNLIMKPARRVLIDEFFAVSV